MVVKLTSDQFGSVIDHITGEQKQVKRFTWTNDEKKVSVQVAKKFFFVDLSFSQCQIRLQLISYGAMITSLKFPGKNGDVADVALGFDSIEGKC